MSLHFDIQRRKKHRYDRELNEVVDDIKTERFLDKEDVDAPIVVTKQQLEARRREDRGIDNYEEKQEKTFGERLMLPLFLIFIAAVAATRILQKAFPLMYGISALFLIFALADKNKNLDGVTYKAPIKQRVLLALAAGVLLALAVWLTIKGK